jgi:hypothetical protein
MVCNGAVILTEDRIIMFGSNVAASASASDVVTGTTLCTSICCCCPCCYGKQSPTSRNSLFTSRSFASGLYMLYMSCLRRCHEQLTRLLYCRVLWVH